MIINQACLAVINPAPGWLPGLLFLWVMLIGGSGCISSYYVVDGRDKAVTIADSTIEQDTRWQGTIIVDGVVKIVSGVTLNIAPGTRIKFTYRDKDNDGIGDSGIRVNGRLIAKGTREEPITFTSHQDKPASASWGEVRVEYSLESRFEYCRFEYADWGLHMHFSAVEVDNSVFENNEGGLRFRSGPVRIRHNIIQNNKVGLRFIHSQPIIEYNTISRNLTGIFIREGVKHPRISHNNIAKNQDYNLKLGEGQKYSVDCPDNWWGTIKPENIEKYIFDQLDADYIGRVNYTPYAIQAW